MEYPVKIDPGGTVEDRKLFFRIRDECGVVGKLFPGKKTIIHYKSELQKKDSYVDGVETWSLIGEREPLLLTVYERVVNIDTNNGSGLIVFRENQRVLFVRTSEILDREMWSHALLRFLGLESSLIDGYA